MLKAIKSPPLASSKARCLAFLLASFLSLSCKGELAPIEEGPRPVKVLKLQGGLGSTEVEFPGTVRGVQEAELAFEVPGRLEELAVKEGQLVRRGDLLARLDARDYQANANSAAARVRAAKAEYERSKALYASDSLSQADLDVARRNYDVTISDADKSQKALEDSRLRAPFTGTVAQRYVENFQNVRAKQRIVFLADDTSLEIVVKVPEGRMVNVAGLSPDELTKLVKPQVIISGIEGRVFAARVTEVATRADPVTRTFDVRCAFEATEGLRILPGMTAKVVAQTAKGQDLGDAHFLVPSGAVFSSPDKKAHVWVIDDKSKAVKATPVTLGDLQGDHAEILEGLSMGQSIAISGVHQLTEGQLVRTYVSSAEKKH